MNVRELIDSLESLSAEYGEDLDVFLQDIEFSSDYPASEVIYEEPLKGNPYFDYPERIVIK